MRIVILWRNLIPRRPHDRLGWIFAALGPLALIAGCAIGIALKGH